jgi:hypothetical protein
VDQTVVMAPHSIRRRQQAIHDLTCEMLRGAHVRAMPLNQLQMYIYKAGVALHNMPFALDDTRPIHPSTLKDVNDLDPYAGAGQWGPWVQRLIEAFELTPTPSP